MFYFVDLPGYGYSKISKKEQINMGDFIEEYLKIRKNIVLIVFLIDIRHFPTDNDKLMYNYIINNINTPCIIIANKADKISPTKIQLQIKELQNILNPLNDIQFLPFSSEKKLYCENVWNEIQKYI